jgi:hypothetical protein
LTERNSGHLREPWRYSMSRFQSLGRLPRWRH